MTLLVVGLVAVIVVVLIAVFLSTRTGRGDEHEDTRTRPRDRDRRGSEDEWQERGVVARAPAAGGPAPRGDAGRRAVAREPASAYAGGRRERDAGARARDLDGPQRRPRPAYDGSPPRRPASAREHGEAEGRYDPQPPRVAAGELPSADHPAMDFPPGDFPTAGKAAGKPARSAPPKGRAAHSDGGSKGRTRAHRGRRDDDDDWPSTEWDKLSDEQYWAEVSADKPLSSMNPPAAGSGPKAAPVNKPAPARNVPARAGKPDPVPAEPGPAKPAAAQLPARELPSHTERTGPREAVTERLPVRRPPRKPARAAIEAPRPARPAPVSPVAATAAPVGPQSSGDQGLAMLADLGTTTPATPGARADDPLTSPSFSRKAASATDSRSYSNVRNNGSNTSLAGLDRDRKSSAGGGRHRAAQPADDHSSMVPLAAPPGQHPSGPYPVAPAAASNGGYPAHPSGPYPVAPAEHPATPYPAQQHPSGPYPAAPATAQHASNGYRAGHPSDPYPAAPAEHPATPYPAQQHPSGPYPAAPATAQHADEGYAQDPASASSGSWYNMPAQAASYASVARTPAGFPDGHAGAGYADGGSAGDYPAPAYRAPVPSSYPDHAGAGSHQGLPVRNGRGAPAEAVSHPSFPGGQLGQDPYWAGEPGQPPYPPASGNGEYADGYGASHRADPYQPDGYGGYAARG